MADETRSCRDVAELNPECLYIMQNTRRNTAPSRPVPKLFDTAKAVAKV